MSGTRYTPGSSKDDTVVIQHEGKFYRIPRSDYPNRYEIFEKAQRNSTSKTADVQKACHVPSNTTSSNSGTRHATIAAHESFNTDKQTDDRGIRHLDEDSKGFKNSMPHPAAVGQQAEVLLQKIDLSHASGSYALGSVVASRNTSEEPSSTEEITLGVPVQSVTTATTTIGSKSFPEVVNSLYSMKRKVTSVIDQTIKELKSQQDLAMIGTRRNNVLQPSGDGYNLEHRVQNLQILETEGFAQTKKNTRKKLYKEIEVILQQLKDEELSD